MNNLCNNALLLALTLRYFCSSVFLLFCSSNIGTRPTSSFFQAHRRTPRPRRERVLLKEKKHHTWKSPFPNQNGGGNGHNKNSSARGVCGWSKNKFYIALPLYMFFMLVYLLCGSEKLLRFCCRAISVIGKRESFVLCLFISDVHSATGKPHFIMAMCAVYIEGFYTRAHTHTHTKTNMLFLYWLYTSCIKPKSKCTDVMI